MEQVVKKMEEVKKEEEEQVVKMAEEEKEEEEKEEEEKEEEEQVVKMVGEDNDKLVDMSKILANFCVIQLYHEKTLNSQIQVLY